MLLQRRRDVSYVSVTVETSVSAVFACEFHKKLCGCRGTARRDTHEISYVCRERQIALRSNLTRRLCYRKDVRAMRLEIFDRFAQSDNTHMVCC